LDNDLHFLDNRCGDLCFGYNENVYPPLHIAGTELAKFTPPSISLTIGAGGGAGGGIGGLQGGDGVTSTA
jgi:hypothetical protein